MVVDHRGQQIVGRADGVQIARKMQIDIFHGNHLRIAAARGAALNAKHRAEAGLAQRQNNVFAHAVHRVCKAYARCRFALARGRRADGRNQDHFCVGLGRHFFYKTVINLCFIPSV